ncbi:MAG: hypothetical protein RID81_16675 [Sandaracinaceae bacterium]
MKRRRRWMALLGLGLFASAAATTYLSDLAHFAQRGLLSATRSGIPRGWLDAAPLLGLVIAVALGWRWRPRWALVVGVVVVLGSAGVFVADPTSASLAGAAARLSYSMLGFAAVTSAARWYAPDEPLRFVTCLVLLAWALSAGGVGGRLLSGVLEETPDWLPLALAGYATLCCVGWALVAPVGEGASVLPQSPIGPYARGASACVLLTSVTLLDSLPDYDVGLDARSTMPDVALVSGATWAGALLFLATLAWLRRRGTTPSLIRWAAGAALVATCGWLAIELTSLPGGPDLRAPVDYDPAELPPLLGLGHLAKGWAATALSPLLASWVLIGTERRHGAAALGLALLGPAALWTVWTDVSHAEWLRFLVAGLAAVVALVLLAASGALESSFGPRVRDEPRSF